MTASPTFLFPGSARARRAVLSILGRNAPTYHITGPRRINVRGVFMVADPRQIALCLAVPSVRRVSSRDVECVVARRED